jgi:phosphatidylglycerophosphate synthase
MAKLLADYKFFDLSDYARPSAVWAASKLKNTNITPIHVTLWFGVCGMAAVYCIFTAKPITAGLLLVLKSMLDALDGELSRAKNTPSYTGRYLDSIFDIIINAAVFYAIHIITNGQVWLTILSFIAMQLQGTMYNYYYVILRNISSGADSTSSIFENKTPIAFAGESQKSVDISFAIFRFLYASLDKSIYYLDKKAVHLLQFPNWFMSIVSCFGLGFQLLIIAILLACGWHHFIIPFFLIYSFLGVVIIIIRRLFLNN